MHTRLLAVLLFATTVAASALAVPITGYLRYDLRAEVYGGTVDTQNKLSSWNGVPADLELSATALANGLNSTVEVDGKSKAVWSADGNSGSAKIAYGWETAVDPAQQGSMWTNNYNWHYTFMADFDGWFEMDYDIVGAGSMFGLAGFSVATIAPDGTGSPTMNPFDPSVSGVYQKQLLAGQIYSFWIYNGGNLSGYVGTRDAEATGTFNWRIASDSTPVPEHANALLLLMSSFTALALARRKIHASL